MTSTTDRPARVVSSPTRPAPFLHGHRQRERGEDGHRRHQLATRSARPPRRVFVEDSATDDEVARAVAGRLVAADVDVVVGGIYSSTRQAIKGPVVDEAGKLYIYPEQYEGQESHPLIFCTGPVPAQQVEPFFPWLMEQTGASRFYLPSADYIWPHTMNKKVREVVTDRGGEIVGEEYFPLDHMEYERVVADIMASGADVVFNTIVRRADAVPRPPRRRLHGSRREAGVHVLRRELPQPRTGGARRGPVRLPRLLPGRPGPVQHRPAQPVRSPLPGERDVHRRVGLHRHLPGPEDVGVGGQRGGVAPAARRHRRPRPRPHPAGTWWASRDGAGPAPRG